ncbi:Fe-S cluster assembly ATPase SufC [Candidatus Woesearchaeota archaeon]|nr:Fe-S cluster assembly ATPase SufC [Candidatus Woesearchaeota archaeon]
MLEVKDLHVNVEGKEILKGVNLEVKDGEIVAFMGPNGSGKSTLSYVLMGHPKYEITKGKIIYNGEDITEMEPNERAKKGLFLSFQYPQEIPGVSVSNFLRTALNSKREAPISVMDFRKLLIEKLELLKMDKSFMNRYLNEGFSGGEKKRAEILQFAVLEPKMAILDETDSGLDIDSLKVVANGVNAIKTKDMSILIITHYQRILDYVIPDRVYVLVDGKIVQSGGKELVHELEEHGYEKWGSSESASEAEA